MLTLCVILSAMVLVAFILWSQWDRMEGFTTTYSPYNTDGSLVDDISQGNPASWSGRPNPYVDINQKGRQDPIIYQGQGIPLTHEDHPTTPVGSETHSMFYFRDYLCRPECCTYSPYSCSNGCVCWEAPPQSGIERNSKISPRS
jgi:hypothetical protein|uniref:Uncharacterized protein n=1 Tax=viral metagenome TaxID=1070528 RepID=A0A6C0BLG6_9ZZZZ